LASPQQGLCYFNSLNNSSHTHRGLEGWRNERTVHGMGPRVARAGPAVGIVVSFYEVVKYALHRQYASS
ncbi:unnamed protein product, partial [Brassica oleracea var. botrytis]